MSKSGQKGMKMQNYMPHLIFWWMPIEKWRDITGVKHSSYEAASIQVVLVKKPQHSTAEMD